MLILNESQLGDFYTWMLEEFPPESDPPDYKLVGVMRTVTSEMDVANLRDILLPTLAQRANDAACHELQALKEKHPQDLQIEDHLKSAIKECRKRSWKPLTIPDILELGENPMSKPTFAIITALPMEYVAMKSLLENRRPDRPSGPGGLRVNDLGIIPASSMGSSIKIGHGVVLAQTPDMSNTPAASVATQLLIDYPSVEYIIMCGIAGGVPSPSKAETHVRVGDIVISGNDGVIEYDRGKATLIGFEHTAIPFKPSAGMIAALRRLEANELEGNRPWIAHIDETCRQLNITRPDVSTDILLKTDSDEEETHPLDNMRREHQPRLIAGAIATSNSVLKDPQKRDNLRDQFRARAVEMESSGLATASWINETQFITIRGICDYCDGRNKDKLDPWRPYAAVAAAALTRSLIESIPTR